ncbi:MAG: transcription elongation factor Spt5 [Candidatus Caldarchaeum sp.]|nr:transcription elongation factor Spt5 [Candidatus Caldarchaeum sp.]MCX8200480.1 transcription elongation factor Spt5 [Candidatus Caldarchaeum sp.]MDW8435116.1 transcription elongation factor Spt5 [Candidatus Caldarchaeum sp.]
MMVGLSVDEMRYFAIKTTVGQERSVANVLEARFHGIFLDYVGEVKTTFTITDKTRAALIFTAPKSTTFEKAAVYVAKKGEPTEPLHAKVSEFSDETGFSDTGLGEGVYDPLLLKTEGWAEISFRTPVRIKRGTKYAVTFYKTVEEDAGYELFCGENKTEDIVFKTHEIGEWKNSVFVPLFRFFEKPMIASIAILPSLKGYVFVEAASKEVIADALQNIRHVKARPPMPVKLDTISPHLIEKPLIEVLEPGQLVEIVAGPLKGITGKVIRVEKSRREVTLELREAAFQLPISVSIDAVRPVEKT